MLTASPIPGLGTSRPNSASCDEEKNIGLDAGQGMWQNNGNGVSLPEPIMDLDEDEIFETATDYQNWTYGRFTLKDLPPFDSSTAFGITKDDEESNLRAEIRKLVQFVSSETPPLFNSYGALGSTNAEGFEELANIVDQIACNLHIIRHENACLAMEHHLRENVYDAFKSSRSNIRLRFLGASTKIISHKPTILSDEEQNTRAYHALVDFVFHSLAWWLLHIAKQRSWRAPVVAVLARWSVKLKLIALDPPRWAKMALAKGENTMRRIANSQKDENRLEIELPVTTANGNRKKVYFPEDEDPDFYYYYWKLLMRENLERIVRRVLGNLFAAEQVDPTRSTAFEMRTLIFRGGLDDTLRHITSRQDRSIESSTDRAGLRNSYRGLQLLLANTQNIAENGARPSAVDVVKFDWSIRLTNGSRPPGGSVTTSRVDDLVSALVPLGIIGSSGLVPRLNNFLSLEYSHSHRPTPIFDGHLEDILKIEFSLSTRVKNIRRAATNVIPSSKGPLIASTEDLDKYGENGGQGDRDSSEVELKRNAAKVLRDYQAKQAETESWAVTEDSVLVHTMKYSGGILSIALAIIGGSLVVPFKVGEGIPGVDPFQIVTFGWLVAGAFLVVAKSRYVENWPWHDFLRGQIVCRSVSELAVASRMKDQAVLLYLLHHEFRHPLVFRGPYHGIFHRHAGKGTQGFNIDVPTGHATVLAAGFIVLKVFDRGEKERKMLTIIQDTRDDAPGNSNGRPLLFDPVESLDSRSGRQRLEPRKTKRLKRCDDSSNALLEYEILGLPTADYDFV